MIEPEINKCFLVSLLMRKTGAMRNLGGLVNPRLDFRTVRVEEGGDARKGGKRIGI